MKKKKPSQHSRNSPTSPNNSSDSGLSVSEAEQTPQVGEEKLKEQALAIEAIKDLKSKGKFESPVKSYQLPSLSYLRRS